MVSNGVINTVPHHRIQSRDLCMSQPRSLEIRLPTLMNRGDDEKRDTKNRTYQTQMSSLYHCSKTWLPRRVDQHRASTSSSQTFRIPWRSTFSKPTAPYVVLGLGLCYDFNVLVQHSYDELSCSGVVWMNLVKNTWPVMCNVMIVFCLDEMWCYM